MRVRYCGVLALALVGCGIGGYHLTKEPTPATTETTTTSAHSSPKSDRDRIELAYGAKDASTLHELLDIVTDPKNHALARDYYVKLQLEALVALDCDAFFAAFEPQGKRPNPRTAFSSLTADLTKPQKTYIASTVLGVAARCHSPQTFQAGIRRILLSTDDELWADALIAIDKKGLPVYDAFIATLRSSAHSIDTKLANKWLLATKAAATCHDIETAAKSTDIAVRASLEVFYVQKSCKAEAVRGARELLTSRVTELRARGCSVLLDLGDTSLISEMEQAGRSDETCKQAAEELKAKT